MPESSYGVDVDTRDIISASNLDAGSVEFIHSDSI